MFRGEKNTFEGTRYEMARKSDKKIVFVCTGNTCRSPMAERVLCKVLEERDLKGFSVSSAGIAARKGDAINPKSAQVLMEHGLSCEGFSATLLDDKALRQAFAIVCMTEQQKDVLLEKRWQALRKAGEIGDGEIENNIYAFSEFAGYSVMDPYGRDIECYRYVYGLMTAGMDALVEKLRLPEFAKKTKPRKTKTETDPNAPPKKRGRPKKERVDGETTPPKKRGRPKKSAEIQTEKLLVE